MDKFIVLRSTDSVDSYPENKPSSFRVLLNEPLYLDKDYVIGLTEITVSSWQVSIPQIYILTKVI